MTDRRVNKYINDYGNGWKFHIKEQHIKLKIENSGLLVKEVRWLDYYRILNEIIELNYGRHCLVLFKCDWWDVFSRGRRKVGEEDQYGFKLVDVTCKLQINEPCVHNLYIIEIKVK